MRIEPFEVHYSAKRVRHSITGADKSQSIEAIKDALIEAQWTLEDTLDAWGHINVYLPGAYLVVTPPDPPIPLADRAVAVLHGNGSFGFLNPIDGKAVRAQFYDPYREKPGVGETFWVPCDTTVAGVLLNMETALSNMFAGLGTVERTSTPDVTTFKITIPNAGTLWNAGNETNLWCRNSWGATQPFHYGGYILKSKADPRCCQIQVRIFEPNGGVYWWTGIRIDIGTVAPDPGWANFALNGWWRDPWEIVANPHQFVLFNWQGMSSDRDFFAGAVYEPDTPGWYGTTLGYAFAMRYTWEQPFRMSMRPQAYISEVGGAFRQVETGGFGIVGPHYPYRKCLLYRDGRYMISNPYVFMGHTASLASIVGKLWDVLLISREQGYWGHVSYSMAPYPSEIVFAGKVWVKLAGQKGGCEDTESAMYIAYRSVPGA